MHLSAEAVGFVPVLALGYALIARAEPPGRFRVAAALWVAASGLFAVYTATFSSYNKTWGTLSAVIVTLTWLWITGMALLLGAEINAEARRFESARSDSNR